MIDDYGLQNFSVGTVRPVKSMALLSFKYLIVIFAVLIYFYRKTIVHKTISNGIFRHVDNHHPGECKVIDGIRGSEDMYLLEDGKVVITSDLGNFANPGEERPKRKGRLITIDLTTKNKKPVDLELPNEIKAENFFPHGINVLERPGKIPIIYVINHDRSGERVEKLEWDTTTNKLRYLKSIMHSDFTFINDLVVLEEDVFYTTVYSAFSSPIMRKIEATFQIPLGSVLLYNKGEVTTQIKGLVMANGINLSNDKKLLYLAQSGAHNLQIYKRHGIEKLELLQDIPIYTLPDNIFVSKNGDLTIGCHPKLLNVFAHLFDTSLQSPSQVLRIKTNNGIPFKITEIFSDDGTTITGSTISVIYENSLLIGSIASELLLCNINPDFLP